MCFVVDQRVLVQKKESGKVCNVFIVEKWTDPFVLTFCSADTRPWAFADCTARGRNPECRDVDPQKVVIPGNGQNERTVSR